MKFARISELAVPITRKYPKDAGADVYLLEKQLIVWPFSYKVASTGITVEIPENYMLLAKPKSRNNHLIGAGVLDCGYQGEVKIKIINYTPWPIIFRHGDAIAQLILVKIDTPELTEVLVNNIHQKLSDRGATGGILK